MIRRGSFALGAGSSLVLLAVSGCHSAFIQATLVNQSGGVIRIFEVDYPSASFGGDELPGSGTFHYRFKVLGSGRVKMTWTDAAQHDHSAQGPDLQEGDEGTLGITLSSKGAIWDAHLHGR